MVIAGCLGGCWLVAQRTWAAALVLAFPVPYYVLLVRSDCVRSMTFDGVPAASASGAVYDQEGAFFALFGGIENVTRPGPNVSIFERRQRPVR